jgi:hypothetical protein
MGAESKPMVVVEFEDGERRYLIGSAPNVFPVAKPEEETADAEVATDEVEAGEEGDAETVVGEEADTDAVDDAADGVETGAAVAAEGSGAAASEA